MHKTSFFVSLIYTIVGLFRILSKSKLNLKIPKAENPEIPCYILGNGPSLHQDLDIENLDNLAQSLFVVNHFAISAYYEQIKPQSYVLADPSFFSKNVTEHIRNQVEDTFMELRTKTDWNVSLYVPNDSLALAQRVFKSNSYINIVGYNILGIKKGFKWFNILVHDMQWATFGAMNVVNVASLLAVYLGNKEIYLCGVDHSWHLDFVVGKDNLVYQKDKHFYDKEEAQLKTIHLDPNHSNPYKMHELLRCSAEALENYHYINEYAKHKEVKIYNCCANSFIDAFERKRIQI